MNCSNDFRFVFLVVGRPSQRFLLLGGRRYLISAMKMAAKELEATGQSKRFYSSAMPFSRSSSLRPSSSSLSMARPPSPSLRIRAHLPIVGRVHVSVPITEAVEELNAG